MLYPAPLGALTQLWAGTMPEAVQYNGEVRAWDVASVNVQLTGFSLVLDSLGTRWQVQTRGVQREANRRALEVAGGASQGEAHGLAMRD